MSFEYLVLSRFLSSNVQIDFELKDNILRVTKVAASKDYVKHFEILNHKMKSACQDLEKLKYEKKVVLY